MITPAFINYQEEAALLGAMVIGYGELDISFSMISGIVLDQKFAVLNACHAVRSEGARLTIANSLASHAFEKANLKKEYDTAYSAIRHCLKIRNQHAHSQWADLDDQGLMLTNAEKAFQLPLKRVKWLPIDLELLKLQEAYFENTRKWLIYLEMTLEQRGKRRPVILTVPKTLQQPILHNLQKIQYRSPAKTKQ